MSIMSKKNYILYGTLGCHLCDDAEQLLVQAQLVLPIHMAHSRYCLRAKFNDKI
jgi:hypothetical protein